MVLSAQQYDYSPTCKEAYGKILALELETGRTLVEQAQLENPKNLYPLLLTSYCDLLETFICEEEEDYRKFHQGKITREAQLLKGDTSSPYHRLLLAELEMHSALSRLKYEENFTAFLELRRAYKLLEENLERFPTFLPTLKSLGILHALLGTVPDQYQWGLKMVGLDGDISKGLSELETLYNNTEEDLFRQEVIGFLAFFQLFLGTDYERAWKMANKDLSDSDNLLYSFLKSDIAYRLGKTDEAISILEARPRGEQYLDFLFLEYFHGTLLLGRLDLDKSKTVLQKFISDFKGRHYIKDAYQRLAWIELLGGDEHSYLSLMDSCKVKGSTLVDADKRAQSNAMNGNIPNPDLLKAQLFFDGAYYTQALEQLEGLRVTELETEDEKLEYYYRLARIYEGMALPDLAINYYLQTIENSTKPELYFAAKSALQCALIQERRGANEEARTYFDKCLTYKGHSYQNSIHHQAKAGLNRLKNK